MNVEEIDDEIEFDKAVGQLRLALGKVLKPLRLYGQDHYVDMATSEIVSLAIQLHWKLSGLDVPYHVNDDMHY